MAWLNYITHLQITDFCGLVKTTVLHVRVIRCCVELLTYQTLYNSYILMTTLLGVFL